MISLTDFIRTLPLESYPGMMARVAELCGIDDAIALMLRMPGLDIYVPSCGKKAIQIAYVKEHYNGKNSMSIAVHLGMNINDVKRIAAATDSNFTIDNALESVHMRRVVSECGREIAVRLLQHFPNEKVRVPLGRDINRLYIEKFFDGANTLDIAIMLRVSERYVRLVIADRHNKNCSQQDLFLNAASM
jgi:Mor family transcriptional regulator